MLDLVGGNVLYIDTDSCVFLSKPGCTQPPLGYYLEELTNEVAGEYGRVCILLILYVLALRIMLIELIMGRKNVKYLIFKR